MSFDKEVLESFPGAVEAQGKEMYKAFKEEARQQTGQHEVRLWPLSVERDTDDLGRVNVKARFVAEGIPQLETTTSFVDTPFSSTHNQFGPRVPVSQTVTLEQTHNGTLTIQEGDLLNAFIGRPMTDEVLSKMQTCIEDSLMRQWATDTYVTINVDSASSMLTYTNLPQETYASTTDSLYVRGTDGTYERFPLANIDNQQRWGKLDPVRQKRHQIRNQMTIAIPANHHKQRPRAEQVDFSQAKPNEIKALHLLRQMIPQKDFRKYLKTGYLSYKAQSGLTYVIRRCQNHVLVYRQGKKICELCIDANGYNYQLPPTDAVITKLVYAQHSEHSLWQQGNIYWKKEARGLGGPQGVIHLNRNSFKEEHLLQLAAA